LTNTSTEKMVDFNSIKEDFDKLVLKPLERKWNLINNDYKRPMTEITQSSKEIIIDAKLPDMLKKNVKLNYNYNTLEILAEKRKGKGLYVAIALPKGINLDNSKMSFKRNKLSIVIPKTLKSARRNR